MGGTVVVLLAMVCVPSVTQSYPTNMLMLALFTGLEGYLLGTISSFYSTSAVMQAVVVTAAMYGPPLARLSHLLAVGC